MQHVQRRTIHHCLDIREVFQPDVVYPLNGRLVRLRCARDVVSHYLRLCTAGNERTKLLGLGGENARKLADEWQRAQLYAPEGVMYRPNVVSMHERGQRGRHMNRCVAPHASRWNGALVSSADSIADGRGGLSFVLSGRTLRIARAAASC